jgi:hypothetical protein
MLLRAYTQEVETTHDPDVKRKAAASMRACYAGVHVHIAHRRPSRWDPHVPKCVTKERERCHPRREHPAGPIGLRHTLHYYFPSKSNRKGMPRHSETKTLTLTPSTRPRYYRACHGVLTVWLARLGLDLDRALRVDLYLSKTPISISPGLGPVFGAHERRCDRWRRLNWERDRQVVSCHLELRWPRCCSCRLVTYALACLILMSLTSLR